MPTRSFTKFVEDPRATSEWVKYGTDYCMEIYVRKTTRMINGAAYQNVLDISNIVINSNRLRGTGEFRRFDAWSKQKAKKNNISFIYYENVLNPMLERTLLRYGFKHIQEMHWLTPCLAFPISGEAKEAFNERYPEYRRITASLAASHASIRNPGSERVQETTECNVTYIHRD